MTRARRTVAAGPLGALACVLGVLGPLAACGQRADVELSDDSGSPADGGPGSNRDSAAAGEADAAVPGPVAESGADGGIDGPARAVDAAAPPKSGGDAAGAGPVDARAAEGAAAPPGDAAPGATAADGGACGAGDPKLPAEPKIPPACATLQASQSIASGTLPAEDTLDTTRIQAALAACASGQAVRLVSSGANNAFIAGPLTLPAGVTLWVDSGATLFASRNPALYGSSCGTSSGSCTPFITASGAASGVVGDGVIDGQGGEEMIGQTQSWWDLSVSLASTSGSAANPTLIQVKSSASNFTLYRIALHNGPKFHVQIAGTGFVIWGITIKTPSAATNSQGTALTAVGARNTDGIDPGAGGKTTGGFIVCNMISDGDDQIAIKGGTSVDGLTIAHNHFGAGHGMSIGSETNGGVSNVDVYDLSIDGQGSGMGGGSSNGIRIKSDSSRGGLVTNVTYSDVCVRNLANPILLTPTYTAATGTLIPQYTAITIQDFHSLASSVTPTVTLDGLDSAHTTGVTLDNVVVEGIAASGVVATNADVTLGPGAVNFTPSGTGVTVTNAVSGTSQPNPCTGKFVAF